MSDKENRDEIDELLSSYFAARVDGQEAGHESADRHSKPLMRDGTRSAAAPREKTNPGVWVARVAVAAMVVASLLMPLSRSNTLNPGSAVFAEAHMSLGTSVAVTNAVRTAQDVVGYHLQGVKR
jgi:hypothetical protein